MYYLSLLPEAKTSLELRNQQANVITTYYMGLSISVYYVRVMAKINLEILGLHREIYMGFPAGTSGKELTWKCRRHKRRRFSPWVGKIPWRRRWQPTPVFLPGESHGQRSLVVYSPWDHKESDMTEATQHMGTHGVYRRLANSRGRLGWYIVVSSRSSVSHSVVSNSL